MHLGAKSDVFRSLFGKSGNNLIIMISISAALYLLMILLMEI